MATLGALAAVGCWNDVTRCQLNDPTSERVFLATSREDVAILIAHPPSRKWIEDIAQFGGEMSPDPKTPSLKSAIEQGRVFSVPNGTRGWEWAYGGIFDGQLGDSRPSGKQFRLVQIRMIDATTKKERFAWTSIYHVTRLGYPPP